MRGFFSDLRSHLYFLRIRVAFSTTCRGWRTAGSVRRLAPAQAPRTARRPGTFMSFQYFAGAACRALMARKDGPSLYEVCDPVLSGT